MYQYEGTITYRIYTLETRKRKRMRPTFTDDGELGPAEHWEEDQSREVCQCELTLGYTKDDYRYPECFDMVDTRAIHLANQMFPNSETKVKRKKVSFEEL